jgi:hypothetical protein
VIEVASTVEDHLLDALGDCALGDKCTDSNGGVTASSVGFKTGTEFLIHCGGCTESVLGSVVDELGVDVIVGAEHSQTRTVGCATDVTTEAPMALLRLLFAREFRHGV